MIYVLEDKPAYDNADEFIADLNKARLANKKKWIVYMGHVEGKEVGIKTYDTGYLQICRIDGINHGGGMDMKVGDWKARIRQAITGEKA